jgi:hypothetical protein
MLPDKNQTFTLDVVGERTKERFQGSFTVKAMLTIAETVDVGLRTDAYNNGSRTIGERIYLMNRAIAEMEVRLVSDPKKGLLAPSWWKDSDGGRTLLDLNVLYEVYNKAMSAETEYEKRLNTSADDAEANNKAADEAAEIKEETQAPKKKK